jgi:hypothetical protein
MHMLTTCSRTLVGVDDDCRISNSTVSSSTYHHTHAHTLSLTQALDARTNANFQLEEGAKVHPETADDGQDVCDLQCEVGRWAVGREARAKSACRGVVG